MKTFLVILSTLFFLFSCQKDEAQHISIHPNPNDQILHLSINSEVRSLDPRIGVEFPSVHITKMLFEGLMITGPDGKVHPGVAKGYTVSEDHKTYTFFLRPSIWSNGDRVTAYDFEYAWKKVIDPSQGSLGVQNFYPIKNVRAIILGEKELSSVGIKALNTNTLKVELEHPAPYFIELITQSSFLPVNATWDQACPNWPGLCGEAFVCNGPYTLTKHSLENEIWVKKNPAYWNAKKVTMPEIHIAIIPDLNTQLNLYEKQQLEWLGSPLSKISLDAIANLKKQNKLNFTQTLGVQWVFINTQSFPFNHKKMRQAFAIAIDRQKIVNYILQCNESPATGVLPYSIASQEAPFFEDGNQKKALELFNEALCELGITKEELPELILNFSGTSVNKSVVLAIQEQWNLTFGIDVKLENQEWKAHFAKVQKGNYQLGVMGWQSWLRDPIYIMQTFRDRSDGLNMSRWENARYQELLSIAEQEYDLAKRKAFFNQAEILLMDEMPVIPLYFSTITYSKQENLKNVVISDLFEVDYRWSFFEE